jgi:hypothetical protein
MPPRPSTDRENADQRMKELILYISWFCQKAGCIGNLSATKLNKILFYSDFSAFLKLGKPITGQEYFALEWGPAPKRLVPLQKELQSQNEIQTLTAKISDQHSQTLFVPLREPDLTNFTSEEISIVDQTLQRFIFREAGYASRQSHNFVGWQVANREETIPYSTAYLDADHILGEDTDWVSKSIIEKARKLEPVASEILAKHA